MQVIETMNTIINKVSLFLLGQQRSKQLATLFKDERCQSLPAFNILEKMLAVNF